MSLKAERNILNISGIFQSVKKINFLCMNTSSKKTATLFALALMPAFGFSQGTILEGETYLSNPLFVTLLGVIIFLLIVLLALSQVLKNLGQSDLFIRNGKKEN